MTWIWTTLKDCKLQACPKGQKVILTVRDSDEKWWKSWCGFNEQEIRRNAMGAFNFIGIVMNKAAEVGYMGPKLRFIFTIRLRLSHEWAEFQEVSKFSISRINIHRSWGNRKHDN